MCVYTTSILWPKNVFFLICIECKNYFCFPIWNAVRGRFLLKDAKYVYGIKPKNLIDENNKLFYCNSTDNEKKCFSYGLTDCSIHQGSLIRGDVPVTTQEENFINIHLKKSFYIVTSKGISHLKVKTRLIFFSFFFLIFVIVYSSFLKIVSSFTFYLIWKQVWDDSLNVNFLFITYWISYRVFKQLKNTKTTDVWLLNSNNSWKRLLKNPFYLKKISKLL